MPRPTFDQIRLAQLEILGERSTCDRGKPACILTKDDRILSEGYAGSPPGLPHCDDVGHDMELRSKSYEPVTDFHYAHGGTEHCIRTVHAEANAIAWAARKGTAIEGATAYVSMTPCRDCAKLMITAGIKKIVVKKDYHASQQSKEMFELAGVDLVFARGECCGCGAEDSEYIIDPYNWEINHQENWDYYCNDCYQVQCDEI